MKKNCVNGSGERSFTPLRKILLTMKLSVFLFLLGIISVQANELFSQTSLSMQMKSASVEEVLEEISQQCDYDFIYDYEYVKDLEDVDIDFNSASLDEVLYKVLKNTNLDYRVEDKMIVLFPREVVKPVIKENVDTSVQQQKNTIKGKVTDKDGVPLPGVSVVIKGTSTGVATDIDGNYSIEFSQENVILVFSFVGMLSQEVTYKGQDIQNVILATDSEQMEEVVVLGTGLTKISKERATGSYSVMLGSDFESSPNEEIGSSLEGNVAGLQQNFNPETGKSEISIRGISTIGSNTAPLIVVDGFPVEGDFSTINPNDIANMTVLKDAAAASIWGARAGNGVIVITTKKGKENGRINAELGSYLKIGEEFDMDYNLPLASVDSHLKMDEYQVANNFGTNFGVPNSLSNGHFFYSKGRQAYFDYQQGNISKADLDNTIARLRTINYKDDVKKYLLRRPVTHQHNVLINGSSDKSNYALSVLYNDVKDHFKENREQKVLINFRNNYQLKDWINLRFAIMTEFKKDDYSGADIGMIKNISPYENLVNEDGSYAAVNYGINRNVVDPITRTAGGLGMPYKNWVYNPLQEVLNRDYTTKYKNTRVQTGLDIDIIDGLKFIPSFQFEKFSTDTKEFNGEDTYYTRYMVNNHIDYNSETNSVDTHYVPLGGILAQNFQETTSYDLRNQITYDKVIAEDHEINLTTAMEHIWIKTEGYSDYTYGYDPDKNTFVDPPYGYGSDKVVMGYFVLPGDGYWGYIPSGKKFDYTNRRVFSFFANAAYTYKKKYTITGSYRTDASNMIVSESKYRYSPFWSIGGSWNAKFEPFLQDVDFVDKLIVRTTYGVSGNTIPNASQVPVISIESTPSFRTGEQVGEIKDQGNPTLRWEQVKSLNIAAEFSLFKRLLYGSVEVYDKKSEDLLANISVAPTYGTTSQQLNAAGVSNKGFELSLNSKMKFGSLTWNTGANISYNKSKVTSLQTEFINTTWITNMRYVEGEEVAPVYSYVYGGMQDANTPIINGENGNTYTFYDDIRDDGREVLRNMGTLIAPTLVGWTNTLKYKGFTFRALMTGKFGHVFRRKTFDYNFSSPTKPVLHEDLDAILAGKADELGIPNIPEGFVNEAYKWQWYNDYLHTLVEKADHIRLKELYLGYDLSSNVCNKLGLSRLTIYTHARDLGTIWTANNEGIDPEYIKGSRFKPGASYTIGFKLGF